MDKPFFWRQVKICAEFSIKGSARHVRFIGKQGNIYWLMKILHGPIKRFGKLTGNIGTLPNGASLSKLP